MRGVKGSSVVFRKTAIGETFVHQPIDQSHGTHQLCYVAPLTGA